MKAERIWRKPLRHPRKRLATHALTLAKHRRNRIMALHEYE